MFQKKSTSIQNLSLNIHHSTFKIQHSKLEVLMLRTIKIFLAVTTTLLILFTNLSCHRTPIEPEKTKVNLIYEDALCTEAYLRLKTTEINYPARVDLYVNKDRVNSFTTFSEDTVFVIENLLPKKSYTSYVRVYPFGGGELVSSEVSFVTMDTTSHDFTWQIFEFGECDYSVLFDVVIINENDIWAVGEIYMRDSLGRCDPNAYNAVHWDGSKWELKRIPIYLGSGFPFYPVIKSIFAFSENNIWFEAGIHWDGISFKQVPFNIQWSGNVNKLWGSSSNDLYAVGNNGNIAHWDGRRWTRIESGTNVNINDIYGVINQKTNRRIIFCSVSNLFEKGEYKILTIDESNKIDSLHWGLDRRINSTWSGNGWIVYTSGGGVFSNKTGRWVEETSIPLYYTNRIRGNGYNDIFVVGDFALLAHYNGFSWNVYYELLQLPLTSFYSISVKKDIIAIVGDCGEKALIIIGRRN